MLDEEKPAAPVELKLCDLPPIEDLKISIPCSNLIKIGKVLSIVDVLAVVESIRSMPPLDLDSILFRSDGSPLGPIFDVFGPISLPHYSIRFNDQNHLNEKDIKVGMDVYFVPQTDRTLTKFAFVSEIQKIKGTDASWEHDNEPPDNVVEYSDDDDEELAKRERRARLKAKQQAARKAKKTDPVEHEGDDKLENDDDSEPKENDDDGEPKENDDGHELEKKDDEPEKKHNCDNVSKS